METGNKDKTNNATTLETGKSVSLEDAIVKTGLGLYQIVVAVACGLAACWSNAATYVVSFVLPTLDCDFDMTTLDRTLISSSMFVGMFLSTHLCGYWADTCGRRHLLWRSCLVVGVLLMATAFVPSVSWFVVLMFLTGFTAAGINIAIFVYASENCSNQQRPGLLIISSVLGYAPFFILPILSGTILSLPIKWNITNFVSLRPWRLLVLIVALPNLICSFIFLALPESPKFSLVKGDHIRTLDTLRTIYRINTRKPKDTYGISSVTLDPEDAATLAVHKGFFTGMWQQNALLFSPAYLNCTIFQSLVSIASIGGFNMVFMWLPHWNSQMAAAEGNSFTLCDTFQCETIVGIAQDTCQAFNKSAFTMNIYIGFACSLTITPLMKLGSCFDKRKIIVSMLSTSVIAFLGSTFARNILLTNALIGTASILLLVTFPLCINIIVDYFPTNIRSTATCLGFFTGRVGATLLIQIMGSAQQCYCYYVFYGLIAFLIGVTLAAILIPLEKKK